jgi:hypothetical protein
MGGRSGRIPFEERIDYQLVPIGFKAESGMSVPGEFIAHIILLVGLLKKV